MPVAAFLRLASSDISESEMILVYVGWLACLAAVKELWKTSLSWATDPVAGSTGDFLWFPIYWLEAVFDAFFLLQFSDSSAWLLWAIAIIFKSFLRDSDVYNSLINNGPINMSQQNDDVELRVLLRDLPPKLRRFSMAAFADVGAKIMLAMLLGFDLVLDGFGFGKSVLPTVYTRPGTTTGTQLLYFVATIIVHAGTIKLLTESCLARGHARLGPLLQSAIDDDRLTDSEWKEEYFHLLDNKHWNITLSAPEYWSEYFWYSITISTSVVHNVLLTYLQRSKT